MIQAVADGSTSVPSRATAGPLVAAPAPATGPASGAGGRIRVGLAGFLYELKAAAEAYGKLHPEVQFNFVEDALYARRDFLAGQVDVLGYPGNLSYYVNAPSLQEYVKAHGGPPKEVIVAYWPYVVAVHPANPMKSITVAQLRKLFFDPEARWSDLGRSTDGRIHLYVHDALLIAQAVAAAESEPAFPPSSDSLLREDELLSSTAVGTHRAPGRLDTAQAILRAMADDEDGILVWRFNVETAASGLKILPVVKKPNEQAIPPTDVAAVASGRYPLRLPLRVAIHPEAAEHVRAFAAWLEKTPQAAEAIVSARIPFANYASPIAPVCMADKAGVPQDRPPENRPVPAVKFEGPIQGAAA